MKRSAAKGLGFKVLGFVLLLAAAASARDIVVSPGDSLQQTRDKAEAGDRIILRGGTYRLGETLVLGPRNSGVTWMAAPGETPVLSGGVPVTGWTPDTNGVWKAHLDRKEKLRQLYVNGLATMAEGLMRRPTGWYGEFVIKGDELWAADGPGKAPDGLRFRKSDIPKLSNPADLELQQQSVWTIQRVGVHDIQDTGNEWVLWLDQPAAAVATKFQWGCGFDGGGGTRTFNAYEFISKPGDFYYNTATGWLYYKPRPGEDMARAEAVSPRLETLVLVKGENLKSHAERIRFEGVTFADTGFQMMKIKGCESRGNTCVQSDAMSVMYKNSGNPHVEPYGLYTTTDVPPAAVMVTSAGDVTFHRCAFRNLGALALNLENDVTGAEVTGNVFQWVEGACVSVGHPQHTYIGKQNGDNNGWGPYNYDNSHDKWDESVEGLATNITVSDNLFRNVCWNLIQMIPITVYAGHSVNILRNDIADTPYSGITCGWNWSEANGITGIGSKFSAWAKKGGKPSMSMDGLRIKNNRVVRAGQVLGDSANIYFLGDLACQERNPIFQQGMAEMTGNYLAQDRDRSREDLIGCDEGTSYLRIEGNVLDGRTGVSSVLHRGTGDRCKLFMDNWIGYYEMEGQRNFVDKNVLAAENHFVQRPRNTNLKLEEWPPEAQRIINDAGLEPAYKDLIKEIW